MQSCSAPMEASPATRLPEADSLPDGFVESFSDHQPAPTAAGEEELSHLGLDPDRAVAGEAQPAGETLGASAVADGLQSLAVTAESGVGGTEKEEEEKGVRSQEAGGVAAEMGGDGAKECLHSDSSGSKGSCAVELPESLTNRKETSEPKRKVVKRGTKSEKELLDLTLSYQKVAAERDAAVAVRERLESLCRELQRQNKTLMEEWRKASREGQNMRLELSEKFSNAIKDVSSKLEEQKEENEMLRSKLKDLSDQYTVTEQQFAHKLKEKMLELELSDLKIQQHQERFAQEQTQTKLYAEQVSQLLAVEKTLRLQLAADGERFQQFQDALSKSNEVFETYKQEMEKMVKLIKDLKKENEFLKSKCEKSDIALVKLVEEREQMKKQLEKVKNQKEKLESLCRSLQAERKQNIAGSSNNANPSQADASQDS